MAERLDRPDREKIEEILLDFRSKATFLKEATDDILALNPDVDTEEGKLGANKS